MRPAALALALAVGGCGGGGGDSSSTASTRSPSAAVSGEKSIEEFGQEASGSERSALLGGFHAYLGALVAKDYPRLCGYLSADVRRSLYQLAGGKRGGARCSRTLPALLAPTAAAIAREQAEGRVTKVRVRGDRAFVVFHASGAELYQMTMVREGGVWKAATVAASVLVPSTATPGQ